MCVRVCVCATSNSSFLEETLYEQAAALDLIKLLAEGSNVKVTHQHGNRSRPHWCMRSPLPLVYPEGVSLTQELLH